MFKKTTLKNGLRIITVSQKSTRAVTVLALVGTGSKYETKEISGISHFLEHMFFKGTKKRPNKLKIAEALDKIGGIYNAFTGQDYTGYFAKVQNSQFNLALDWVSDIYLHSILPKKEMKKEKGVIIEEINMGFDSPMRHIQTLWSELLYGDQPAGWDILGTKENVLEMTQRNLLNYMRKQYVASNTIVCVAGNVNSSLAIQKVKKYFSKIKTTLPLKKPKFVDARLVSPSSRIEKQIKPDLLLNFRKTDQAHICLGARGYNIFHPQRYVQEILAVILGGMMSSRLFMEVREKLGIAYYVKTDASSDPESGFLVTQAGIDNKNIEKAISTILKEYKKISQKMVSKEEFKKAKDNVKGKMALILEPSDALASFYAGQELLENRILTSKQIFKLIDEISINDILKVAKDIFKPEKLNLALIGPFKNKKRFEKILNKF